MNSGTNSASAPSSAGATSSSISESLTPDGAIGDGSAQNATNFSSFMAEQLIADGVVAEDDPGTLPHVIVIYLVSFCTSFFVSNFVPLSLFQ